MKIIEADVLVVGAGLSGLRSACAALEKNPKLKVKIATICAGPSGSSFTNRNDELGIQMPLTDLEKNEYLEETLRLARSGEISTNLIRTMVEDAHEAYDFLKELGVDFKSDEHGHKFFTGCFSKAERALVFKNLKLFFKSFSDKFISLGGEFITGLTANSFIVDDSKVYGVVFSSEFGDKVIIRAGKVIAALGGPSGLWKYNLCGSGQSAISYGMLSRAGVKVKNASFSQFMWCEKDTGKFILPGELFRNDTRVVFVAEPFYFRELMSPSDIDKCFQDRNTHCSSSCWLDDSVLDTTLVACMDDDGYTLVQLHSGEWINIVARAHSCNGGALIDEHGQTEISGLYCCGECATGMHGANRLGGGMVLSGLVFGRRAGEHAAETVAAQNLAEDQFRELSEASFFGIPKNRADISEKLHKEATIVLGEKGRKFKDELMEIRSSGTADNVVLTASVIMNDYHFHETIKYEALNRSSAT